MGQTVGTSAQAINRCLLSEDTQSGPPIKPEGAKSHETLKGGLNQMELEVGLPGEGLIGRGSCLAQLQGALNSCCAAEASEDRNLHGGVPLELGKAAKLGEGEQREGTARTKVPEVGKCS